jgi:hypothetical protein
MKNLIRISWVLLSFLSGCNRKINDTNHLMTINIAANLKRMEVVKLSQITDNIRYVTLETKNGIPFIYDLDISSDQILITDIRVCSLYDISGKLISKIGNHGRGPGD